MSKYMVQVGNMVRVVKEFLGGMIMLNRSGKKPYFGIMNGRLVVGLIMVLLLNTADCPGPIPQSSQKVIRESDMVKMEKMAEALSKNNYRDLWKEVKKIKGRNRTCTNCIDGHSDDADICDVFQNKYEELYNCVHYDVQEVEDLKGKLMRN